MEQVDEEMTEIAQGLPNLKKEMNNLQLTFLKQDSRLEEIRSMLKEITTAQREEEIKQELMVD